MEIYKPFAFVGVVLIVLGLLLVVLPLVGRYIPSLERLPWIIVWVYSHDGFYFATSPLLIIISIVSVVINHLNRTSV